MYFWRIEQLKKEMSASPLSDRKVLPYLIAYVALTSAAISTPQANCSRWNDFEAVQSALFAALGAIYIYRQNGGAGGQHFLQRYFAIGWVVFIRLLAGSILVAFLYHGALQAVGVEHDNRRWMDLLFYSAVEAIGYWRIGHHVKDLAQKTTAS